MWLFDIVIVGCKRMNGSKGCKKMNAKEYTWYIPCGPHRHTMLVAYDAMSRTELILLILRPNLVQIVLKKFHCPYEFSSSAWLFVWLFVACILAQVITKSQVSKIFLVLASWPLMNSNKVQAPKSQAKDLVLPIRPHHAPRELMGQPFPNDIWPLNQELASFQINFLTISMNSISCKQRGYGHFLYHIKVLTHPTQISSISFIERNWSQVTFVKEVPHHLSYKWLGALGNFCFLVCQFSLILQFTPSKAR